MVPLFGAIPGGPELLIVLLMMLMMLAIPIAFAVGLFLLGRWSATRGSDETEAKIAALRTRVDELESELEAADDEERGSDRVEESASGGDADTAAEPESQSDAEN